MRSIKEIKNIKNKKVLVRVDFNVPMVDGKVGDDFRIKKALPTIEFLQKKGAKIILISHLGKGGESLLPVSKRLNKYIKVRFVSEVVGQKATEAAAEMKVGDVILLENLRNDSGEQSANKLFAMELAKIAGEDGFYVNECFSVDHREDASIMMLPKLLPAYAGLQLVEEIKNLSKVVKSAKKPFLFILGGAKFSTKMPLIKKYIALADYVFIGGALMNNFLKAKGYEVGRSLVDDDTDGIQKLLKNKKLIIAEDVLVKNGDRFINKKASDVAKNEIIMDIGSEATEMLAGLITKSKTILWNGPLGKYEAGGAQATKKALQAVAKSKAFSVIGGGDTVDLISEMKIEKEFGFVSTGGGATLDFLAKGTLPGIKALK